MPFSQWGAVLVEGASLPLAANLLQGDVSIPVDEVDQPDVSVEIVLCHIACFRWQRYEE